MCFGSLTNLLLELFICSVHVRLGPVLANDSLQEVVFRYSTSLHSIRQLTAIHITSSRKSANKHRPVIHVDSQGSKELICSASGAILHAPACRCCRQKEKATPYRPTSRQACLG